MCADSVAHLRNATAANYAANAAANAANCAATYAANAEQEEKNKQFLIQCINEFPSISSNPSI